MRSRFFYIAAVLITTHASAEDVGADCSTIGRALFFDTNLSLTRRQSCATCHEPENAFADGRVNRVAGAASVGDDGVSLGSRNTPGTTYASRVPRFHQNESGDYVGGLFLDGRASTLEDQAEEPFFNPLEMAMPDQKALADRIRNNPAYVSSFKANFGDDVLTDDARTIAAATTCLAAFERSDLFATFDSKYDRYLIGEYQLTQQEELGRLLFFSQLVGCYECHLADFRETGRDELFTNHEYHNIGVPVNPDVRAASGITQIDNGLLDNPFVDDPQQAGKFRVPSLRNVAVTAPYMHNGVFQDLETAILFYDKYLLSSVQGNTNPETGARWRDPEVAENVSLEQLRLGQPITPSRAAALAAFLRTLTDRRYESLLE